MLSIGVVIKRPEVLIEEVSKLRDFVCASCSEFGSCESEDESQDSTRSSASER